LVTKLDPQVVQNITDIARVAASVGGDVFYCCAGPGNQAGIYTTGPQGYLPTSPDVPVAFIYDAATRSDLFGYFTDSGNLCVVILAQDGVSLWNGSFGSGGTCDGFYSQSLSGGVTSGTDGIYWVEVDDGSPPSPHSAALLDGIPGPVEGVLLGGDFGSKENDRVYWYNPDLKAIFMTEVKNWPNIEAVQKVVDVDLARGAQIGYVSGLGLYWLEDTESGSAILAFNGEGTPLPVYVSETRIYAVSVDAERSEP